MLRKFATATILGAEVAPQNGRIPEMWKAGHRVTFEYEPRPGYLYVRSRMISSRCNDNFDEFPAMEIVGSAPDTGYTTFVGKPVFVNHHNANHRRARGVITQVALHEDLNPDGSPDTWVEGLMEVDALRFNKLAEALVRKHIERTSMGVDVAFSICAACGNRATTPGEYCRHIPSLKGRQYVSLDKTGARISTLIRETCHGLKFFENSLLVEEPADPTAFTLGNVELGPGLDHLAKSANRRSDRLDALNMVPDESRVQPISLQATAGRAGLGRGGHGHRPGRPAPAEDSVSRRDTISLDRVLRSIQPASQQPTALQLVAGRSCVACASINTIADLAGNTECADCGQEFHASSLVLQAAGPKYPNPSDHPWFQKNPAHHDNIVSHWNDATEDEKTQGKNWYSDAHIIAKALGEHHENLHGPHPHGAAHLGAGIVANYSPQMGWAGNMHNAGRVLHEGKGIGGPGSGIFASNQQKGAADRMLAGARHEDALGGPKIQDFAHLIEHGGDRDPQQPRAVIDRHALSVATGKRMSEDDYSTFPKSQRHYYGHVVNQYHEAAKRITEQEGEHVAAHQVQAVTWLARQRKNQDEERAGTRGENNKRLDLGRERGRQKQEQGWQDFRKDTLPDLPHAGPGTGYQASRQSETKMGRIDSLSLPTGIRSMAYGETKAPADVDTLRDESCPVCGEANAWDGNQCPVCNYVQPPKQFQDPDLDMARQVDLRKNDGDLDGTDVTDLNAQTNDRDGDGLDDVTGEPVGEEAQEGAFDEQPSLVCPNCETEFEAGEPQTINTRDPQAGSDSLGQPEAGDVCPACGKAELMTGQEMQEMVEAENTASGEEPGADTEEDSSDLAFGRPDTSEEDGDEEEEPDEDPDEDDEDPDGPPVKRKGSPFNR